MGYTYNRSVEHCSPAGDIVRIVTVESAEKIENSDRLDVVKFEEVGYQCISGIGQYKPGDKALFIPPDCVIPNEISDELGVTQYLRSGLVKVVKLRGVYSEGVLVDADKAEGIDLDAILKWETSPTGFNGLVKTGCSYALRDSEVSHKFEKFYKMPNLMNDKGRFYEGEEVIYSEKIHGTNCRFGWLNHPKTGEPTFYIGSHNVVIDPERVDEGNIYLIMCNIVKEFVKPVAINEITFYGEIYGAGVQHLSYGEKTQKLRVFAAMKDGVYLPQEVVETLCMALGLETVRFHVAKYQGVQWAKELASSKSEVTEKHHREGIVIASRAKPGKMAKVISSDYLESKNRTESH